MSTYIQIQKNMYKSYSLQALCSHIYSCHNRQQNHSMAGPSFSDMQVEGPTMRELSNVKSEIKTSRVREVGEGGEEEAVVADVYQGLKLKFRAAWTLAGP